MIQRIQTVYLLFAFCLAAILVFIPFSTLNSFTEEFFRGFNAAIAVAAIVTIFFYKNRRMQLRLCYAMLAGFVAIYLTYFIFNMQNFSLAELFGHVRYIFIFPFISIILVYLAIRGIKKDEKLVRSLDRLRG